MTKIEIVELGTTPTTERSILDRKSVVKVASIDSEKLKENWGEFCETIEHMLKKAPVMEQFHIEEILIGVSVSAEGKFQLIAGASASAKATFQVKIKSD